MLPATVAAIVAGDERAWTLAGLIFYAGVLAVTFAVNVPLNNALAAGTGSDAEKRPAFEQVSLVIALSRS